MTGASRPQSTGEEAAEGDLRPPCIAALFLIKFDKREGYKITWKQAIEDLQLDGIVEYKSLPSGLHNLDDDVIYFTHEQYAGLSAFVKGEASEEDRNANFVAVGVLASLGNGRMGRSWLHIQALHKIAINIATKTTSVDELETYWQEFRIKDETEPENEPAETVHPPITDSLRSTQLYSTESSKSSTESREQSASTKQNHYLPPSHPATAIHEVLETFGPLIFPLHRAAILRKRILFLCSPPLKRTCNLVYNVSILSNISSSTISSLSSATNEDLSHIRPLFTVGVHDIPALQEQIRKADDLTAPPDRRRSSNFGWIACSTDGILEVKKELYDILVHLPSAQHSSMEKRQWPVMKTSRGKVIKATQRDLKRYRILEMEMRGLQSALRTSNLVNEDEVDDPNSSLLRQSGADNNKIIHSPLRRVNEIVEPLTWSALAYNSFLWWASAGERDVNFAEEDDEDIEMIKDLFSTSTTVQDSTLTVGDRIASSEDSQPCLAVIEYFNRLGTAMVTVMADMLELATEEGGYDGREEEFDDGSIIRLERLDLEELGLDIWSEDDREFVSELARLYFGMRVTVRGLSVECCGVRLC